MWTESQYVTSRVRPRPITVSGFGQYRRYRTVSYSHKYFSSTCQWWQWYWSTAVRWLVAFDHNLPLGSCASLSPQLNRSLYMYVYRPLFPHARRWVSVQALHQWGVVGYTANAVQESSETVNCYINLLQRHCTLPRSPINMQSHYQSSHLLL